MYRFVISKIAWYNIIVIFLKKIQERFLAFILGISVGIALYSIPEVLAIGTGFSAAQSLELGLAIVIVKRRDSMKKESSWAWPEGRQRMHIAEGIAATN